jgi:cob(I)alamin adenosyltransferase
MKIYTRTGDQGSTGLLGGTRVGKDHLRIECYGTVDELNSHVGLYTDLSIGDHVELMATIQYNLFTIGSRLACSGEEEAERFKLPTITDADIAALEAAMDTMDADLEPMRNFILPGGHPAISQAHICRTVCRRAERRVVELAATEAVPEVLIRYLNRLSDLFFVVARHEGHARGVADRPWRPRG